MLGLGDGDGVDVGRGRSGADAGALLVDNGSRGGARQIFDPQLGVESLIVALLFGDELCGLGSGSGSGSGWNDASAGRSDLSSDGFGINSCSDEVLLSELQVSVVVGALRNIFRINALAIVGGSCNFENGSQRTSVLARSSPNADKVLSAIFRVSVFGENTGGGVCRALEGSFFAVFFGFGLLAALDLIGPLAHAVLGVEGEAGSAGEPVGEAVAAVEESGAVLGIREGSEQAGAVGCFYGGLDLGSVAALDVVHVVAVFGGVGRVDVVEDETVAANFQLGGASIAVPVLVTAVEVRVEALELVRAFEVVLLTEGQSD